MNMNRTFVAVSLIGLLLSVGLVACGDSDAVSAQNEKASKNQSSNEKVAIRVDNETLSKSKLQERIKMKMRPFLKRFGAKSIDDLPPKLQAMKSRFKRRVIKQSVTQLVLLSHAKQSGITVSDREVDKKWNSLKKRFPSEKAFKKRLKKMGKTKKDFVKQVRESIMIKKFIDRQLGDISVSQQEMRDYFRKNKSKYKKKERVHARHILLKSDSQAQSDIKEIKQKIDSGASFEKMARKHSEGPSSRKGGDLGTFPRGKMAPAFEKAAFSLPPGVVSDPVKTKFGYHLIKVEKKMDSAPADFTSNREQIRKTLKKRKRKAKMRKLVQRLKRQSEISKNVKVSSPKRGLRRAPSRGRGRGKGSAGRSQSGQ